ncbi:hypothetical protein A3D68_02455 [Candidatus Adlerbacteria bacterium RIFCSPHIGHO2_02_FULL_52_17]|uniref:Helix-turn-helix domain-containing protein n=1 Tax=Candidatus Adlerbacteria bacterium RIFCSPHIGHO2_02_FULL_52_17 TaxID=1797240 RepID=A0A1F4XPW8_9BACT|nr:MAG: hypothetical protein A3D68_02455 [Candidatus Adlerbacteria bacterium RIFCSPHIGHO2_02_FULL_52_17]
MDELEISGRRYISSRRAAKEHKYHSDYIGQLIRGGKVEGQKVGRAWYVGAESLAAYLNKENVEEMPTGGDGSATVVEKEPTEVIAAGSEPEPVTLTTTPETAVEEDRPYHVAVHVTEPVLEKIYVVPNEEKKKDIFQPKQKPTLVYLTDDEPMLPRLFKREIVVPEGPNTASEAIVVEERSHATSSRHTTVRAVALACVGLFVLVAVAGTSVMFKTKMVVEEGKPASVGISFL